MNDKRSFIEQGNQTKDWVDVLKDATNKAIDKVNVATLAYVENERDTRNDKYDIITVSPFPLEEGQKSYTIRAYARKGEDVREGDIVVVLFTNKNFINNLDHNTPQESSNQESHPITCGVIVYKLYDKENE